MSIGLLQRNEGKARYNSLATIAERAGEDRSTSKLRNPKEGVVEIYTTEEEQVEALKKWWRENGKAVIAGVIIGFGAIFSWREWQAHVTEEAQKASRQFQEMAIQAKQGQSKTAHELGESIIDQFESSAYATLAAFSLARMATEDDRITDAKGYLMSILEQSNQSEFQHIARLRLARLLLAEGDSADAEAMIDGVDVGQFLGTYQELRGDILVAQGKPYQARAAYLQALASTDASASDRSILQLKLDDLGQLAAPEADEQ